MQEVLAKSLLREVICVEFLYQHLKNCVAQNPTVGWNLQTRLQTGFLPCANCANLPYVQTGSRLPGTVWRGLIFFTTDRPHCILKCPHFPGTITAEWFWLCVRSQCHHIWRMRTFDENSCAISITSPRSLSPLRTQHVWWDHREKSWRASTLWDCPANGTQSEHGAREWYFKISHASSEYLALKGRKCEENCSLLYLMSEQETFILDV